MEQYKRLCSQYNPSWGKLPLNSLKKLKALQTKKGRDAQGRFIVEGEKLVTEIPADYPVCAYVYAASYAGVRGTQPQAAHMVVPDRSFAALSDTVTPQGVLAVCEKRPASLDAVMGAEPPFLLLGENLSDPGNIGTLIRTAAAAGADAVVLSAGSGELYNPKVLRAAAGAALRLPVIEGADLPGLIALLRRQGVPVLAAHLQGAALPYGLDLRKGCAILVGNEARGLSEAVSRLADVKVRLPMQNHTESLNASVAGGILLYEVVRQRLM